MSKKTKKSLQTFLINEQWHTFAKSKALTPRSFIQIPNDNTIENNPIYQKYIKQDIQDVAAVCNNANRLKRPHTSGYHRRITAPAVAGAIGVIGLTSSLTSSLNFIISGSYAIQGDSDSTAPGIMQVVASSTNITIYIIALLFIATGAYLAITPIKEDEKIKRELELFRTQKKLKARLPELHKEIAIKEETVSAIFNFLNQDEHALSGRTINPQERERLRMGLISAIDEKDNLDRYLAIQNTLSNSSYFIKRKAETIYLLLLGELYRIYSSKDQTYFVGKQFYDKSILGLLKSFEEDSPSMPTGEKNILAVFFKVLTEILSNEEKITAVEKFFRLIRTENVEIKKLDVLGLITHLFDNDTDYKTLADNIQTLLIEQEKIQAVIAYSKEQLNYKTILTNIDTLHDAFNSSNEHQTEITDLLTHMIEALGTRNFFDDSEFYQQNKFLFRH